MQEPLGDRVISAHGCARIHSSGVLMTHGLECKVSALLGLDKGQFLQMARYRFSVFDHFDTIAHLTADVDQCEAYVFSQSIGPGTVGEITHFGAVAIDRMPEKTKGCRFAALEYHA